MTLKMERKPRKTTTSELRDLVISLVIKDRYNVSSILDIAKNHKNTVIKIQRIIILV